MEKSRTVPKKIERGDPSVSSDFADARKKFLAKATTRTQNKLATVIVGHFSLGKRRLKNSESPLEDKTPHISEEMHSRTKLWWENLRNTS